MKMDESIVERVRGLKSFYGLQLKNIIDIEIENKQTMSWHTAVCRDDAGVIYVTDATNNAITKLDLKRNTVTNVTDHLKNEQKLNKPWDVDFDNGRLYVVDSGNERVLVLDSELKVIAVLNKETLPAVDFKGLVYLFIDRSGNAYMINKFLARVYMMDRSLNVIKEIIFDREKFNERSVITSYYYDFENNIWYLGFLCGRIYTYSPTNTFTEITHFKQYLSFVVSMIDFMVYRGTLILIDNGNNVICKVSKKGEVAIDRSPIEGRRLCKFVKGDQGLLYCPVHGSGLAHKSKVMVYQF